MKPPSRAYRIRLPRGIPGPRWETPDPVGVTGTYGDRALAWAERELGIVAGPWQAYIIRKVLRHDAAGNLIHRTALISTARQNGKSVIVRILFGWMLAEGHNLPAFRSWTTLLAAAHDAKQARLIYKGVYGDFLNSPTLKALADRLTLNIGIEVGGLLLDTVTSQPGSARGLSAGAIAWDEMLTQEDWSMWEALSPTQSAQTNPLMILTSTAGHPASIVLRAFYDRLVRQASGDDKPDRSFYGAWWQSPTPNTGLDWRALLHANPALKDGRLAREAIRQEHAVLPPDSWQRERLNHWVDVVIPGAFNPGIWASLRLTDPLKDVDPPFTLGVDIQPGWERATITAAAIRPDNRIGVEVYRDIRAEDHGPISAASIIAAVESFPDPVAAVIYDQVSGAAAEFERHGANSWGVEWRALKPFQVVTACMDATEMILSGRLAVDDPLLDAQVPTAARRPVGQDGAFRFSRAASGGPIDAVMAMTFAAHAVAAAAPPPNIV